MDVLKKDKLRVFIGCLDVASILTGTAEGFKKLGHKVTTFVFEKNKYYPHASYDIVKSTYIGSKINFQKTSLPLVFKKALQSVDNFAFNLELNRITSKLIDDHDLFIFIWQPWIREDKLFKRIKAKGKKIICFHVGSDVRHVSAYEQEFKEDASLWEKYFLQEPVNPKLSKVRYHELFADIIFSVPDQEGLAIRGYNHLHIPMCNLDSIPFYVPKNDMPIVLHSPTRHGMKGTKFICDAVEQLKSEGFQFEFRLLENLPNTELINELVKADILVDELFGHGPGVLSLEAIATGCIVATRTLNTHKDIFNPPVININPRNVYTELKRLLQNPINNEQAILGRKYILENNNPEKIAQRIIESLAEEKTDYTPSFYMNFYEMPIGEKLSDSNKALSTLVTKKYFKGDPQTIKKAVKRGLLNFYE